MYADAIAWPCLVTDAATDAMRFHARNRCYVMRENIFIEGRCICLHIDGCKWPAGSWKSVNQMCDI